MAAPASRLAGMVGLVATVFADGVLPGVAPELGAAGVEVVADAAGGDFRADASAVAGVTGAAAGVAVDDCFVIGRGL